MLLYTQPPWKKHTRNWGNSQSHHPISKITVLPITKFYYNKFVDMNSVHWTLNTEHVPSLLLIKWWWRRWFFGLPPPNNSLHFNSLHANDASQLGLCNICDPYSNEIEAYRLHNAHCLIGLDRLASIDETAPQQLHRRKCISWTDEKISMVEKDEVPKPKIDQTKMWKTTKQHITSINAFGFKQWIENCSIFFYGIGFQYFCWAKIMIYHLKNQINESETESFMCLFCK